ncbi:MAG: transposase [Coriobacteriia bacterium]|nr:transposase [Coriobacteriia bacterium]
MPRPDYRIPSRRERELFKQVRDLRERLDSLSRDPSATLEISRLEGIVAERGSAIAALESELESERARTARLRGELESSRAKRKRLESQVRQLKCDVGNERARTRSAQSRYETTASSHARLLEENGSLKERNSELEAEVARKDALIEHLNARLSRTPENSSLPPSSDPNRKRIPNSRARTGRKPGGQPGHRGHRRRMPDPDDAVVLEPESACCPRCGCGMAPTGGVREHSVTDIEVRTRTTAYAFHGGDAAVYRASDAKGHAGVKGSPLEDAPDATVVSDHDTTYHSYGRRHAECNCHILRYLKGVAENEPGQAWAGDMAALLKLADETAKKARAGGAGSLDPAIVAKFESCYRAMLESALEGYMASGATSWKHPPEGIALARRMLKHADKHLLFLRDLSVPFENNGSERLLRKAKGKLKQSGGFRSTPNGEQPYCDFLTIVETAKMRGIQPYRAVHATFAGEGGLFA